MQVRGPRRPPGPPERRKLNRLKAFLAAVGAAVVLSLVVWPLGLAWWLDYGEDPVKSDYLVVLAGDFARPHLAAGLYKDGLAPEVWLARPIRSWGQREAQRIGVDFPNEEDLDKAILLKRGVPETAIRLYGDGTVDSTFNEARAFKAAAHPEGKKVLVLTSRYHARRAKIIFKKVLAGSQVTMVGAADPEFTRWWWRSRGMMYAAVLETAKGLYWLAGGNLRRVSP